MLVGKASVAAIFTTLKTTFNKAFSDGEPMWSKIAMRIKSTTKQNDYAWLSRFPKMRRWVGEKFIKNLKAHSYTVTNEDFEATIEVTRNDIEDDNLGIYGPQAQEAGVSARELPDDLVFELVNGAFSEKCYDGQYFCDTDHPVVNPATKEEESVSNKLTVALSSDTIALARASIGAAALAMKKFKDDEGRPLNVRPNILLVPPALEEVADVLYTAKELEDGKPNPYKGKYKPVVSALMTSDTAWFLLDTSRPVKPFIFQDRKSASFVNQTSMDSDDVFNRGVFKFGVEARAAAGYGFWQLAVGSTGQG